MNEALNAAVTDALAKKRLVKIEFYSEINEFLKVTALIKKVEEKNGELVLELATGQEIPFSQLVRVGKVAADKYDDGFFHCSL